MADQLSTYVPTLLDSIRDKTRKGLGLLGMSPGMADSTARSVRGLLDWTPLGGLDQAQIAMRQGFAAGREGDTMGRAKAAGMVGMAMLPLPGPAKGAAHAALREGEHLAMDEASRMARAKAMGFDVDTPMYHGTNASFDEFKVGPTGAIYASPKPEGTQMFTDGSIARPGDTPNTMPVVMKMQRPFDLGAAPRDKFQALAEFVTPDWNGKREKERGVKRAIKQFEGGDFSSAFAQSGQYVSERMRGFLKDHGFDGIVSRNADGSVRAHAVLEPEQVRSRFAKFDPRNAKSGNLLAGVGAGLGLLGGYGNNQTGGDQ